MEEKVVENENILNKDKVKKMDSKKRRQKNISFGGDIETSTLFMPQK